jgi:hypothetical protein
MIVFNNRKDGMRPEVADIYYDNNIYSKWAFDNNKEFIKYNDDSVKPDTIVDTKIRDSVGKISDTLQNILDFQLKNINQLEFIINKYPDNRNITKKDFKNLELSFKILIQNDDIIRKYNEIIRQYIDPKINSNTRQIIKTDLQRLSKSVDINIYRLFNCIQYFLKYGFRSLTDIPLDYPGIEAGELLLRKMNNLYLIDMIKSYCILYCIQNDLFTGYYNLINNTTIEAQYPNFIKQLNGVESDYVEGIISQKNLLESEIRKVQRNNFIENAVKEFISEYGREPSRQEIAKITLKMSQPVLDEIDVGKLYDNFKLNFENYIDDIVNNWLYDYEGRLNAFRAAPIETFDDANEVREVVKNILISVEDLTKDLFKSKIIDEINIKKFLDKKSEKLFKDTIKIILRDNTPILLDLLNNDTTSDPTYETTVEREFNNYKDLLDYFKRILLATITNKIRSIPEQNKSEIQEILFRKH